MNRFSTWVLFCFVILLLACSKTEINTIPGNQAPEDQSISELQISSYITRLYISNLGRKASDNEFTQAKALLIDPKDSTKRSQLVNSLLSQYESKRYFVDRVKQELIEGIDSSIIRRDYDLLSVQINDTSLNPLIKQEYEKVLVRLDILLKVYTDYTSGASNWKEVIRACLDNLYYDQINMGTENFVVSMFQHFLDRYPSSSELNEGKNMVNGLNASLFLQNGSSKDEFIDIFLDSDAFLEGRIHRLFESYLFRKANQDEVLSLTKLYLETQSYQAIQHQILIGEEYFKK